jgi:hypothetical protein
MDKNIVEQVHSKLLEMNKIISKLDPAIRSAAFEIMVSYYFDDQPPQNPNDGDAKAGKGVDSTKHIETNNLESFINSFEHGKPSENAMILAAWLYSQYGAYPVQAKEIKELADACGLVIPNRSDNTMRIAKDKGKSLFNQQGKGWKPTVSGELYFKNTYKVKKGNKIIPK